MRPETCIRVVEDNAAMREALVALLACARLPARGYESAEALLTGEDRAGPICVVSDLRLPGIDGIALLHRLRERNPGSRVLLLTGYADVPVAVKALKAGAADFMEKPFDPGLLVDSVRTILAAVWEGRSLSSTTMQDMGRLRTLTPRERQVVDLLCEGQSNKIIAGKLGISVRTAEHHRAHVMEKLGARSLPALVRMCADLNV
jgi:two-component system response regulator FixJ